MGLSIGRKVGQTFYLWRGHEKITVKISNLKGGKVILNIDAPESYRIYRDEWCDQDGNPLPQTTEGRP